MKWTQKPITWGAYAKLCAVCYAISIIAALVITFWNKLTDLFDNLYERIYRLWNRKDREP